MRKEIYIGACSTGKQLNYEKLISLYKTYEFSDEIILVNEDITSYPSLYNYVNTGILSKEELEELIKTNESRA